MVNIQIYIYIYNWNIVGKLNAIFTYHDWEW